MKKKLKIQSGAAVVEFALILPILILLLFGVIEFGTLMYNQQVLTNASREGARAGIVAGIPRLPYYGGDTSCTSPPISIEAVVQCYAKNHLITFGSTNLLPAPTITPPYDPNAPFGTDLEVTVNYNFEFLVIPNFIPGINRLRAMSAETLMKYE